MAELDDGKILEMLVQEAEEKEKMVPRETGEQPPKDVLEKISSQPKTEEVFDVEQILQGIEEGGADGEKANIKIKKSSAKPVLGSQATEEEIKKHANDVALLDTAEEKIEKLIQIAKEQDPASAIRVARHLQDNYVLDQTQGELTEDAVYEELVKRGLVKENL